MESTTIEKVLIPHRGVIALDIIDSLKSIGYETILLFSPEDANSLPVKLADRSFKFYSSKLEDSYLDSEAIIEKALELKVDYINPGYGFLAEDPKFARLCEQQGIRLIGPGSTVLETVRDKLKLRKLASELGITILAHSKVIRDVSEIESALPDFKYPLMIKPLYGKGGRSIKVADYKKDAIEAISDLLKRAEAKQSGVFLEEFFPYGHHIEVPFFRDKNGNILFLPEIESSVQRRFQKIFQESPSVNLKDQVRSRIYQDSKKLIEHLDYVGLGHLEFILVEGTAYFSEINPSYQINSLISEIHIISNFIKKQFAITNGGLLHDVSGTRIVEPKHSVLLVSLMAENPFDNFQPSSGVVTDFFYYSAITNIFKTDLFSGARISPFYDPYIGKIATFSKKRENSIKYMKSFLNSITIKGVRTNLNFLKGLINCNGILQGETIIDFLNLKYEFGKQAKSETEIDVAAALLATAFHIDNKKKNFKVELETMKQPGFFKKLFNRL